MSAKQITWGGNGKPFNYAEFLCDTENDIENLPTNEKGKCAIGSRAFVISSNGEYILSPKNKWVINNLKIGGDI